MTSDVKTIGGLFSGVGILEGVAASMFAGSHVAWHSEIDPSACKVLESRFPGVPNLGDISAVDWHRVEPVDVIVGGFPCQDVSAAGLRAGLNQGTRSGLWSHMRSAIEVIRPQLVMIENVKGLLSARAIRTMGSAQQDMDKAQSPQLRALGAVLGDLAEIGYDASWLCLEAAEVGAAHHRARVFILAHPQGHGWDQGRTEPTWVKR